MTGVGGGSVRDLLIGAPVFWVHDPWVAPVILLTALIAWFTPRRWWEGQLLDWADAVGLPVYAVLGTAKALAFGVEPVPAILMGVITGCVGGIIRDVLAGAAVDPDAARALRHRRRARGDAHARSGRWPACRWARSGRPPRSPASAARRGAGSGGSSCRPIRGRGVRSSRFGERNREAARAGGLRRGRRHLRHPAPVVATSPSARDA